MIMGSLSTHQLWEKPHVHAENFNISIRGRSIARHEIILLDEGLVVIYRMLSINDNDNGRHEEDEKIDFWKGKNT
jgi:hypothetical protein